MNNYQILPTVETRLTHKPRAQAEFNIDQDLIDEAMARSPSGGNSKPFTWRWENGVLHISHNTALAHHYLNRNQHTSLLTLGCLITSVEVASHAQGYSMEVSFNEKTLDAKIMFLPFSPNGTRPPLAGLLSALFNRSTYRGKLVPSPLPTISKDHQVKLCAAQHLTSQFSNFILSSQTYMWKQIEAARSFFKEVNFFTKRTNRDSRGIRSQDLGIGLVDQILLYVFSFLPILPWLIIRIPLLNQPFLNADRVNLKNSHFLLVTTKDLTPESLINSGRRAMRSWLELEQQGYKAQPYSMASITLVDAATKMLPGDTHSSFQKLFTTDGPLATSLQFGLRPAEHPVWLLRFGRVDPKSGQ